MLCILKEIGHGIHMRVRFLSGPEKTAFVDFEWALKKLRRINCDLARLNSIHSLVNNQIQV